MRTIILIIVLLAVAGLAHAQEGPVHWNYTLKKVADKTYELYMTGTVDKGWHIYAQVQPEDALSFPTTIRFTKNPMLEMTGKPIEIGKKEKQHVEVLDVMQYYYSDKVDFVQKLKLKGNIKTNISGSIEYMACTDERCLPAKTVNFNLALQ